MFFSFINPSVILYIDVDFLLFIHTCKVQHVFAADVLFFLWGVINWHWAFSYLIWFSFIKGFRKESQPLPPNTPRCETWVTHLLTIYYQSDISQWQKTAKGDICILIRQHSSLHSSPRHTKCPRAVWLSLLFIRGTLQRDWSAELNLLSAQITL